VEQQRTPPGPPDPDEGHENADGPGYTARPSKEKPEDGGRTRRHEDERSDSPEGREQD
jgi:hypothetical protein